MPYPKDHAEKSRGKILASAYKFFVWKGFDATSIDEIMQDCQMTRGAFYWHFQSKTQLYREAIVHAALQSRLAGDKPQDVSEQAWLGELLDAYLDKDTSAKTEWPCPLAFFVSDVTHREPDVRHAYTKAFSAMNAHIHGHANRYAECREGTVLAVTAMLIGAVAITRTIDDDLLRGRLLDACRELAAGQLGLE
ncbi:MAG TPA: TetR family transcriptional regulator [Noviherbaspirillum sp.]|nr:TetR family transcriptional regulator [Noviherbaspirillum sp.]